ncbi:Methylenetetrahydrofolate--tRNA-(uracil-5-)-methyltransferase TrmFO [bioreactor metagenome]|uniref:Methylenetetrahydrofolate--tRNA-(Uracil-5-)-methyltransferase TrmFO n=1 Tax=bioreactor metagenome TaxID=1076179 RepID=A0A644YJR7_9ZZZZ|nr:methylenetetrahydrofolate--tRNA-(uracil(54)-C(5))-methyltransferase (FADH(2)-oxidizing) TrmFO [Christensenella sp.]
MSEARVLVIGAGLAGCEAAYQLAKRGIAVDLYEMKPQKMSPAHHSADFCELVCSNSLRSDRIENAVGLLKAELRELGSLVLSIADETRVPAGGALAVDREGFAARVTEVIRSHPNITVHNEEIDRVPDAPAIIATGPLTADALAEDIARMTGEPLHFYDAAAPIVTYDSLDRAKVFRASRYGRGDDYLNCPMTREEYTAFYQALISAETADLHAFETPRVFEGCMPVEVMAKRGEQTLCYGPLKPVGLEMDGREPYAVVQLRQDDKDGRLFNIVGFQTNLKFAEQRRVFGLIPGLEHAEFARYGVMHRNTFLNSPKLLDYDYQMRSHPGLYFAGQMTGVEGYVESASSGFVAALSLANRIAGKPPVDFSDKTAIGSLGHYVSGYVGDDFQPMNVTFGIMDSLPQRIRKKTERYGKIAERALATIREIKAGL